MPGKAGHSRFVPGVNEVWALMSEGDVWEVYVPSELGYGAKGNKQTWSMHVPDFPVRQSVGPDEALVYRLEMGEIKADRVMPYCSRIAVCVMLVQ